MPTADDVGNYLRATVTYEDKSGEKAISGVTAEPVEARTLANARPKFSDDIEAITVNENVSGAIGDPILATDDDNDVLLYALIMTVLTTRTTPSSQSAGRQASCR